MSMPCAASLSNTRSTEPLRPGTERTDSVPTVERRTAYVSGLTSQRRCGACPRGGRRLEEVVMARIGLEHDKTWFVRLVEWGSRRKYGKVPDPGKVALHNRRVLTSMLLTEGSAARWNTLDPTQKALTVMVVSARIGCSWCMDFGYWEFHHQGVDPVKLRDVPRWRDSDVYTDLERAVMDFVEVITAPP